jgi:hypothetical protein
MRLAAINGEDTDERTTMKHPRQTASAGNTKAETLAFLVAALLAATQTVALAAPGGGSPAETAANSYRNFHTALYCPVRDMRRLASDSGWAEESWNVLSRFAKVDNVWLETYRGNQQTPEADVRKVKEFFRSKGIKTSGGMMPYVGQPGDRITGFCFTNPEDRERFRTLVAYTASLFDEIIVDDLFIFNCRCKLCQQARGDLILQR